MRLKIILPATAFMILSCMTKDVEPGLSWGYLQGTWEFQDSGRTYVALFASHTALAGRGYGIEYDFLCPDTAARCDSLDAVYPITLSKDSIEYGHCVEEGALAPFSGEIRKSWGRTRCAWTCMYLTRDR